ncbi:MAG: metallophosphoesterase [Bryobacteraceae bacterium]
MIRRLLILAALASPLPAQKFYTYVGDLGPEHVLIAWGTTAGANTIGRSSKPHGTAVIKVGGQEITVQDRNYAVVRGLTPDTEYSYQVSLNKKQIGNAQIRTWPEKSEKLRFFVIGDFGSGDSSQARVAEAMWQEYQKYSGSDNPVRFVITTGDNIYGTLSFSLRFKDTGDEDFEWENKYFKPYEPVIARIPWFPSLGNHDGNETESRADLATYLDNFFFPNTAPARYYRFSFGGGLADFFALDSTTNAESGPSKPTYLANSDQHKWLQKNLTESQAVWKIPYFHHPPYNAGPRHPAVARELAHFLQAFKTSGVKVVFNGHEHNFQYTMRNGETGDIRYVVSGAGGELRDSDVKSAMAKAQIEAWAPQFHYLLVEIEGKEMRVMPKSFEDVEAVDRNGRPVVLPLKISR